MGGEFLKKAQEYRARDEMPAEQLEELTNEDGGMPELLFRSEDEILAVVEAAEMWAERYGTNLHDEEGMAVSLTNRLSALDRKASESS